MQLAVINIIANGSDKAVVLNGEIILTCDPSASDDLSLIDTVSDNLAKALSISVTAIDTHPSEDWTWGEVIESLIDSNQLIRVPRAITPESIEQDSKIAAVNAVFDLDSGSGNADIASIFTPAGLYDVVTQASSLDIKLNDVDYLVQPYWPNLTQETALEILGGTRNAILGALNAQYKALTQCDMVDWRISQNEPLPEEDKQRYHVNVHVGNQLGIEITDAQGEPSLGILVEINHGVPAIHIDVDGGDSVLHIHKGQGGLVLTPDNCRTGFVPAAMDELSYRDANAQVIRSW